MILLRLLGRLIDHLHDVAMLHGDWLTGSAADGRDDDDQA